MDVQRGTHGERGTDSFAELGRNWVATARENGLSKPRSHPFEPSASTLPADGTLLVGNRKQCDVARCLAGGAV